MTLILFVPFLPGITVLVTEAQRLAGYCFSLRSECGKPEGESVAFWTCKSSSLAFYPRRILSTATFCPLVFFKTVFPSRRASAHAFCLKSPFPCMDLYLLLNEGMWPVLLWSFFLLGRLVEIIVFLTPILHSTVCPYLSIFLFTLMPIHPSTYLVIQ